MDEKISKRFFLNANIEKHLQREIEARKRALQQSQKTRQKAAAAWQSRTTPEAGSLAKQRWSGLDWAEPQAEVTNRLGSEQECSDRWKGQTSCQGLGATHSSPGRSLLWSEVLY